MNEDKYNGSNDYYPKQMGKISYPEESQDYWKNFRDDVCKVIEKSEDDFEKYLNIFGSGGLIVGLTILGSLIEKSVIFNYQWMLILGTFLFVVCLLSNLLSHYVAIKGNTKTIAEIDSQNMNLWNNFKKRNRTIEYLNWSSLLSIIFGTILITSFLTVNLNTMAQKNSKPQSPPKTTQSNPQRSSDQKGRVAPQPAVVKPPKTK